MIPIDEGEHDEAGAPHNDGGERVDSEPIESEHRHFLVIP